MHPIKRPKLILTYLIILAGIHGLFGQSTNPDIIAYIRQYKDIAIHEMKKYKIPSSITLAQGILESGAGKSLLATEARNHFGIKCHKEWTGKTFHMDDEAKNECFRKYKDPEESYRDHSLFLTQRPRYASLFELEITDYKAWAHGLKSAGYATNPRYPELLIRYIEEYELYKFDKQGRSDADEITQDSITETPPGKIEPLPVLPYPTTGFAVVGVSDKDRTIYINNKVRFIFARDGDTPLGIAREFRIYAYQIFRYNDLDKDAIINPGDIIYIQAKKNKAKGKTHSASQGETMHFIAQLYGVKMSSLYKLNKMRPGTEPKTGKRIRLY